jgi:hypothetical protein
MLAGCQEWKPSLVCDVAWLQVIADLVIDGGATKGSKASGFKIRNKVL